MGWCLAALVHPEPDGVDARAKLSAISNFDPRAELPPLTAPIAATDNSVQRMGVYPVTRSQFGAFIREGGYADSSNWRNKQFFLRARDDELEARCLWN